MQQVGINMYFSKKKGKQTRGNLENTNYLPECQQKKTNKCICLSIANTDNSLLQNTIPFPSSSMFHPQTPLHHADKYGSILQQMRFRKRVTLPQRQGILNPCSSGRLYTGIHLLKRYFSYADFVC